MTTVPVVQSAGRAPIWPVLIAPLVALVYYFSSKIAFVLDAGGFSSDDIIEARWGSYWLYRTIMETCSIAIGTFVAAGLARGREKTAGVVSGITITFLFVVIQLIDLISGKHDFDQSDVIEVLIIIGAPLLGFISAIAASEMNRSLTIGFADLNRFHLLWLWLIVFCYVIGLIGPTIKLYKRAFGLSDWILGLALGVPLGAIGILLFVACSRLFRACLAIRS